MRFYINVLQEEILRASGKAGKKKVKNEIDDDVSCLRVYYAKLLVLA